MIVSSGCCLLVINVVNVYNGYYICWYLLVLGFLFEVIVVVICIVGLILLRIVCVSLCSLG